jgi:hypothetical protein
LYGEQQLLEGSVPGKGSKNGGKGFIGTVKSWFQESL